MSNLINISPIDGRYAHHCEPLRRLTSELGLFYFRTLVEIEWFKHLCSTKELTTFKSLSTSDIQYLDAIVADFNLEDAEAIKAIEQEINHDVKAVEYYLRQKFQVHPSLKERTHIIHFACTSEDINNVSYALMYKAVYSDVLKPTLQSIVSQLRMLALEHSELPMLARTHGQPASPTTLGKELANVIHRLQMQLNDTHTAHNTAKFNGAVGNFNAHVIAFPEAHWPQISRSFIEGLGLEWLPMSTQIEPHDDLAGKMHHMVRINTVLIDFCQDIWRYIAIGTFKQKMNASEVGSSTMPHKVNPIDFENAEGNLAYANAIFSFLAGRLPISRWQRDLTDSTLLRNVGVAFAHTLVAYQSLLKGLDKLAVDQPQLQAELHDNWEILTEAVQTVMRAHGITDAYEQLKAHSRGKRIDQATLRQFIEDTELPEEAKARLLELTPSDYTGLASKLTQTYLV